MGADWSDVKSDAPPSANGSEPDPFADVLDAQVMSWAELSTVPPPEPLIEDVLLLDTMAVLFGPPGVGKSFVALDWGLSVATGAPWFGHEVHQGAVLYVVAEGSSGIPQRVAAWLGAHGQSDPGPARWLPRAVNLLDPRWAGALAEVAARRLPVLTIMDTVARSMPGGDENSSKDMGAFIEGCDLIRQASGGTVVGVHHVPREGGRLRGHSSLDGAVDTAIEARAGDEGFVLKCTKQKDMAAFADIRLALAVVGDSCVVTDRTTGEMTLSGRAVLEGLASVEVPDGVPATVWMGACTDVARRTFFYWRSRLLVQDLVCTSGTGRSSRYSLSEQGKQWLTK